MTAMGSAMTTVRRGQGEASIAPATLARQFSGVAGTRMWWIAGLVTMAALGVLSLGSRADARLMYDIYGAEAESGIIEARRGEATVRLSDGSSILAENGSRFSVDVGGRNAAVTRLLEGKLHVRVEHREDSDYTFRAGGYEVHGVGTEFALSWNQATRVLDASISKGRVKVTEPSGHVRSLGAGGSIRSSGHRAEGKP